MSVFEQTVNKIGTFEGFRGRAYRDAVGVWTVGYGTTIIVGRRVEPSDVVTERVARALLRNTLCSLWREIAARSSAPAPELALAALTSFAHNLGLEALKGSHLWRLHQAGDFAAAAAEFSRWNHAGGRVLRGLTVRRAWEAAQYRAGYAASAGAERQPSS